MQHSSLTNIEKILIALLWYKFPLVSMDNNEIFRQDIGQDMEIGISDKGYKTVQLKCGSNSMLVELETDEEFFGVIYTRGSFYDKNSPCFHDADSKKGQKSFEMKIPFDSCNTKQENNVYSNVLILQHDKELIMPGDAAFDLECDFSKPRDVTVTADVHTYSTSTVASRITLIDADPSKPVKKENRTGTIESYTDSVILSPEVLLQRRRDEL